MKLRRAVYRIILTLAALTVPVACNNALFYSALGNKSVTYSVASVAVTGGTLYASGALTGDFVFKNTGATNGSRPVSWTIYASPTGGLGAGNVFVVSGTTAALNAGATSSSIPFSGSWPSASGSYYLVASITSPDSAGASGSTLAVSLIAAAVDYFVPTVNFSSVASTSPGGTASGTFQIQNNGPNAGVQPISWKVYANTTPTAGGTQLGSGGTTPALAVGGLSPVISFSGTWPSTAGNYYLVVSVSSTDQDANLANNTTAVFDAALTDPTNNTLAGATAMGITLQPSMTLQVTGTLSGLADYLTFNSGTANTVTFSATWSSSTSVTLNVVSPTPATVANASATGTSLSTTWNVAAGDQNQLMDLELTATSTTGVYVLTITAN